MSLLGAIKTYYADGVSSELDTLRTALGTGKMYADEFPPLEAMPFCVLTEVGANLFKESKTGTGRRTLIVDQIVGFEIWATGRAKVEEILEALENAYMSNSSILTVPNRRHDATFFSNRQAGFVNEGHWGRLDLSFRLTKSGT